MSKIDCSVFETITIIVPTDPIDVICVSGLPKWTWGGAGTPPHPGATTWFVLLHTHYKTRFAAEISIQAGHVIANYYVTPHTLPLQTPEMFKMCLSYVSTGL